MRTEGLNRRSLVFGMAGLGLGLGACASTHPEPQILINLAEVEAIEPAPIPEPERSSHFALGRDDFDRMTIPVRLNGQGPFNFVVDTGATRTVVCTELAAQLELPNSGLAEIHGIAGAEVHPTVLIGLLQADAVGTRAIRAPTLPRARLGCDGLLGVDVLRGRLLTLDFLRRRLRIGPARRQDDTRTPFDLRHDAVGSDDDLGTPVIVPAQYRFGQLIIVAADVLGHPVKAFLDSGSQSTVGNVRLNQVSMTAANPHAPVAPRLQTQVLSATGQTASGDVGRLPPLRIGGLTITGLNVVFADLHVFDLWQLQRTPAILIGIDVMRRFSALQLDYAARQVLFYPRPRAR